MEGSKRRAVLLSLIEYMRNQGSWCGETHIQKCTYFLQEVLYVPTEFEFILYKHGPFSFDLRDEISDMRANLLLELHSHYPLGPSNLPGEAAAKLKEYYPRTIDRYSGEARYVAERLSGLGVSQLERLATALYVTLNEENHDADFRARKIVELKPHIRPEQASEAVETVDVFIKESSENFQ